MPNQSAAIGGRVNTTSAPFFIAMTTDLYSIASETFNDEKFVHVPDVPVFCEHEREGQDGETRKYTRAELEEIIRACNQRILDTGDFAALTEGHTPDKEDLIKGAKQPRVLGFSGPFKLGRIGKQKQRYAILADEWHFKDTADEMKRLPRRSVELWLGDKVFDPIAALGAQTPHLDLGLKFCRLPNGQQVEKYVAAMPSGDNTFIPSDKEKYAMPMAPEDIAQVVEAIQQLPQFQWIDQQMQAQEASPAQPSAPDNPMPYEADEEEPKEEYQEPESKEVEAQPQPEQEKMSRQQQLDTVAKYRKLEAENADLKQNYARQEERLVKMERKAADAERERIIDKLSREFMIDPEEEKKACLYSRDSKMTDAEFTKWQETVVKYAQPNIEGRTLPTGEMPDTQRQRYAKEEAEAKTIVAYCKAKNITNYEQGRQELIAAGKLSA